MSMGGVFRLLERLGMGFPNAKLSKDEGMDAEIVFKEDTVVILKKSSTDKVTKDK